MNLTRRRMLSSLGAGAGAYALSDTFWPASAGAESLDADELPLLIFCEFNGAWDTLLSLDPRDHTDSRFNDPAGSVYTGYEMVAEEDGAIVDVSVQYPQDFMAQMLEYSERYSFLPTEN